MFYVASRVLDAFGIDELQSMCARAQLKSRASLHLMT